MLFCVPIDQERRTVKVRDDIKPNELVKVYRQRKALTQEDLARAINCSQMQISRIERGLTVPEPHQRIAIEAVLKQQIWSKGGE